MCGRYLIENTTALRDLSHRLFYVSWPEFAQCSNAAPSQTMPVIATGDDGKPRAAPFFFAGIYESATEIRLETFLVFTTSPNALMAKIHNRMPAILPDEKAKRWLAPGPVTADQPADFTASHRASRMVARPISVLVNNPKNDSPEILAALDDGQASVRRE